MILDELEAPGVRAYLAAILVDEEEVDLASVVASVSIRHGRDDIDGPVQASTATLRLRELSRAELKRWEVGGIVRILDLGLNQVFVGQVTDVSALDDDPRIDSRTEVIAVGGLAALGRRSVGGHAWPAETWTSRVGRIFYEAGVDPANRVVQAPSPDVNLAATKPTDPETGYFETMDALSALDLARNDVGATCFDDTLGRIAVQAFDARGRIYPAPIPVDPSLVLYSPAWSQTLDLANRIVLGYGYGAGTVTVDDPVSQERYGLRWTGLFDSGLADAQTAETRARAWLSRVAYPRWKLPGLTLLEREGRLAIGAMLDLSQLPDSAPFPTWAPVVEGWTDIIEGPDWTQDVVLSDPVLSGLGLDWQNVPPELLWQAVDPACLWRDAYYLGNLQPGRTALHAG